MMFAVIEFGPSALTERELYARGGGLFDEGSVNRSADGEFSDKSGPSGSMADEPFALGGAPKHGKGKKASDSHQGSLFDKDLHGAEARDLPGQTNFLGDDGSGIDKSDAPSRQAKDEPFDSKKWDDDRDATIKASRAAGNKHLDDVEPAVETMRGRAIYNAHDPKEIGIVRTVSNNGDVVVQWEDDHSAGKNSGLAETWLMPSDLKDYVFDDTKPRKTFTNKRRKRAA